MNNIKNTFTISDMEVISGVKAHTIRIWEKRYNLLEPQRAARNIRYYSLDSLQKLLNIALLNKLGEKISKIASLSQEELQHKVATYANQNIKNEKIFNELKIAMYKFDADLFEEAYAQTMNYKSFSEGIQEIFFPFLHFLGLCWQTSSIKPVHEHFITNLLYQKIQLNTSQLPVPTKRVDQPTFILYLPQEEMHEISLLFLNYELRKRGFSTIYLGRCIPLEDLKFISTQFPSICWLSIFIMSTPENFLQDYFKEIANLLDNKPHSYWVACPFLSTPTNEMTSPKMKLFTSPKDLLEEISGKFS